MAYDAQSDRVILFGGEPGGTWAYDFDTNRWTTLSPSIAPTVVTGHAMAYDAESDRVILFGGDDGFVDKRETWAYDFNTNTWTNLNPPLAPGERSGHAMAYDAESDRVILFGGCVGFPCRSFGDTWAYDFNTNRWTDLNPSLAPNQRSGHMMAYDAQSDRIILFGGYEGNHRGDTWAYDVNANTWTNLSPSSAPRARRAHAMAYGRQSDRVILFGGCIEPCQGGSDLSHETWAYDFNTNTWTNLNPSSTPSRRWLFAMAYDARADEIILFGGSLGGGATSGETWAYRHYIEPRDIGTVPRAGASVQGVPDARYRSRY
jgi:N-acetylneuraminic acid mutarotase